MFYRLKMLARRRRLLKAYPTATIHDAATVTDSSLGERVKIASAAAVVQSQIGDSCFIGPNCELTQSSAGRYSYFAGDSIVRNTTVGAFCSIARGLWCGLGEHPTNFVSTHPAFFSTNAPTPPFASGDAENFEQNLPITIGSDVWIGARVFIRDGVTIGDGAIIAAGSIVTRNVEPYAIVAGTPARLIRYRFSEEHIAALKDIRWWDWPDKSLAAAAKFIGSGEVDSFIHWATEKAGEANE